MKIIRKVPGFKNYDDEADKLFKRAYHLLPWWVPSKFFIAKEITFLLADEIQKNLIHRGWVVLKTNAPKQSEAVDKFWYGVLESIEAIEKIEK